MNLYRVYVNDSKSTYPYEQLEQYWLDIDSWARNNCASYVGYDVQDVSDVSLQWDEVGEYRFFDEKDTVLFKLKWGFD